MRKRYIVVGAALAGTGAIAIGGVALAASLADSDPRPPEAQARQAIEAALGFTGGGKANSVELDSEDGATYEVEVTRLDGTTVDVRLDKDFGLVVIEGDSEAPDNDGDGE